MTENLDPQWQENLASAIGRNIREARFASNLSVQEVANRCTELGLPMLRTTLANLEAGKRKNIAVAEVIALGQALGVAPLTLIFPPSQRGDVEYTAGQNMSAWGAWRLFTDPLVPAVATNGDQRGTYSENEYAVVDYVAFERVARPWKRARYFLEQPWITDAVRAAHESDVKTFLQLGDKALRTLEEENFNLSDLDAEFLAAVRAHRAEKSFDDASPSA